MIPRWSSLFTEQYPASGASESELQEVSSSLFLPVTDAEASAIGSGSNSSVASISSATPLPLDDPRKWWLPAGPLPDSYLDFLRWSNGGSFLNGERRFDPFLPADKLREYLLSYQFPRYIPGAIPFALNGGGCFYAFDMRRHPKEGEYPVLFISAGNLSYEDAVPVADSFLAACKGSINPTCYWMD